MGDLGLGRPAPHGVCGTRWHSAVSSFPLFLVFVPSCPQTGCRRGVSGCASSSAVRASGGCGVARPPVKTGPLQLTLGHPPCPDPCHLSREEGTPPDGTAPCAAANSVLAPGVPAGPGGPLPRTPCLASGHVTAGPPLLSPPVSCRVVLSRLPVHSFSNSLSLFFF